MATAEIEAQFQQLSEAHQKLQEETQAAVESRQKLESQRQENLGVSQEFETLDDEETIYKLVGPILLKQDKAEARSIVNGRLDYIGGEITNTEARITELNQKMRKSQDQMMQMQVAAQNAAQGQA